MKRSATKDFNKWVKKCYESNWKMIQNNADPEGDKDDESDEKLLKSIKDEREKVHRSAFVYHKAVVDENFAKESNY